jgi:UPF0755 protein
MSFTRENLFLFFRKKLPVYGGSFLVVLCFFFLFLNSSPQKEEVLITFERGASGYVFFEKLQEQEVVRSSFFMKVLSKILKIPPPYDAGEYKIPGGLSSYGVLVFLKTYTPEKGDIKITFPEGITRFDMVDLIVQKVPTFDSKKFLLLTEADEGFLFPDTYSFLPTTRPEEVRNFMKNRFDEILAKITNRHYSEEEKKRLVIFASLLEEEGKTYEDKRIIAGIIKNRLERGMRLELDATINYIKGFADTTVSWDDLDIVSPFNTYRNKGLPPAPISNPGEESLRAALDPQATRYLFYLTGADGKFYYAETFEGHKKNRYLYLR